MPPHPHHNMPPHPYPRIPTQKVCLCPYFTSTNMYVPYVVPQYPHISPLGFLHTSSSRLASYVLPPHSLKKKYRSNRRNRLYNYQKKNRILAINRMDRNNCDLVFIYVYESHEDLGRHKGVSILLSQTIPLLI